jgi:hypothetical protein
MGKKEKQTGYDTPTLSLSHWKHISWDSRNPIVFAYSCIVYCSRTIERGDNKEPSKYGNKRKKHRNCIAVVTHTVCTVPLVVVNEYDTLARTTDKGPTVHIYRQHAHCEISIRVTHIAVQFHDHWEILMCALYTVGIRLHRSWNSRVIGGKN